MKNKDSTPFLYFNFVNHNGKLNPLQFKDPINIIVARSIEEVMPCLTQIQQAVSKGYYAAGYLSYEAAPAFDQNYQVNKGNQAPLLWFGIFDKPEQEIMNCNHTFKVSHWNPNVTIDTYNEKIDKIHNHILAEETEQVNYTIRLSANFEGDSLAFYKQLEDAQSANYSAYIDIEDYTILSSSPELFFHLKDGEITTRPMKGTIGRGNTYEEDIRNADWLKSSKKNRFENELVVNLMINELEKIAVPGTIKKQSLYEIEKYPTVYQMTSTVKAEIPPEKNIIDIFKALFPSGSITGLPKIKTMEIISEIETSPREVYCGAIGFITPENEAVFNVPIRTVLIDKQNGHAQYGVGGAITHESTKEEEYAEVLIKAELLVKERSDFKLLETLGLKNGEYLVLDEHLTRLKRSAQYFDFMLDIDEIKRELRLTAIKHNDDKHWKVRLIVDKNGEFTIETEIVNPFTENVSVALSNKPIEKADLFLYHKTTNRKTYDLHREFNRAVFDVLLWNDANEITEFTMGNIVIELEGKLITPPIECGVLAGTYREVLLQKAVISELKITVEDLRRCQNIWFINSVREWVPVNLIG